MPFTESKLSQSSSAAPTEPENDFNATKIVSQRIISPVVQTMIGGTWVQALWYEEIREFVNIEVVHEGGLSESKKSVDIGLYLEN